VTRRSNRSIATVSSVFTHRRVTGSIANTSRSWVSRIAYSPGRVARSLRARGDEIVAVVRDPARAGTLRELGARLVAGDLGSEAEIRAAMAGSDAVIHIAGVYRVGIPASERPAMYEANVTVTERVLDAAIALRIPRIVHTSTVNVFGNTRGRIPDETYRRDPADGFLSYYDETKYAAHLRAETRIAAGAPIVIVQPGTVYGSGDHSAIGPRLKAAYDGTARYVAFGEMGISPTHVDDIATGIVAALAFVGIVLSGRYRCSNAMESRSFSFEAGGRRT